MVSRNILLAFALAVVVIGIACTASNTTSDPATDDDGQLGTISSTELVGSLSYGKTSAPVLYTASPRYRAFAFDGHIGDAVDIVVQSIDGVAMAWLQDSASQTVAYDFASAHDAHVVQTLPSTGTFLIVFRESTLSNATFTVTLSETPLVDGGSDGTDASDDAPIDAPDDGAADATADANGNASCTFTRSLTGTSGCSQCVLPQPFTSTHPLSVVIDSAGGGASDNQVNGGKGRTLHMNGVSQELSVDGCVSALALDGVPPAESWLVSNQGANLYCPAWSVGTINASVTVTNGDQVSLSFSVSESPGVTNCGIVHGCVSDVLSCSGTTTATLQ